MQVPGVADDDRGDREMWMVVQDGGQGRQVGGEHVRAGADEDREQDVGVAAVRGRFGDCGDALMPRSTGSLRKSGPAGEESGVRVGPLSGTTSNPYARAVPAR